MNAIRICIALALSPLMVLGVLLYLVVRGVAGGYSLAEDLLDKTNPFGG